LDFSSGVLEVVIDKNPTCGAEAELGIQIPTETALDWTSWIIEWHNGPHYIPKRSATIAKIAIPFQSCSQLD